MINGSEISNPKSQIKSLEKLFDLKSKSPVTLVRIACHVYEFIACLPAASWLKKHGYSVGFNIMQVADCSSSEITKLALQASKYPIDVLYFADSMGGLKPFEIKEIVGAFKRGWAKELGIHTHNNMGLAIENSKQAIDSGVSWIDSTVTGMGRGPGNAQTEYMILALSKYRKVPENLIKLFKVVHENFKPMQKYYEWGTNPFYFLSGQHGIHPSYIQEMLKDKRYQTEDILNVINHLKKEERKKFNVKNLEEARNFYHENNKSDKGTWSPQTLLKNKEVLILATGESVKKYQKEIEIFIKKHKPYVIALNAQSSIREKLIDARAACHPFRLLADYYEHLKLPQPLISPISLLPEEIKKNLKNKKIFDFGIKIRKDHFKFHKNYCELPNIMVAAYAFAIATSGKAKGIYLAGFDGYEMNDPRRKEMDKIFVNYKKSKNAINFKSITPTNFEISIESIFGIL